MERRLLLLFFVILGCTCMIIQGAPTHASCILQWKWSVKDCSIIHGAIIDQMTKWKSLDDCNGEKCGYTITSNSSDCIKGIHESPVRHYKDDLLMTFSGSCTVQANSTSEVWYAVLDYGTNYCNLHNLVMGAGLDQKYDFKEYVSDDTCTQASVANCKKY